MKNKQCYLTDNVCRTRAYITANAMSKQYGITLLLLSCELYRQCGPAVRERNSGPEKVPDSFQYGNTLQPPQKQTPDNPNYY